MGSPHLTWVRLHATRLDDAIADGVDPLASGDLARRADQLLTERARSGLARGLRRAVRDARRGGARSSAVHVARAAIRECAPLLLTLAAELGDLGVRPRGVAMTRRLLTDGTGPLFNATDPEDLRVAIDAARAAL